jgi:DNA-binding NarL/FixJ family response regulator
MAGNVTVGATRPARIVIADDHELARAGLRSMLAGEPGIELVGEATNGREAVERCRELRPDLVLLDVRMPEMDGMAATRAIKAEAPHTAVLIVTMYENPEYLMEALRAGAAGYVLKDASRQELLATVRKVLRGEGSLNNNLATRLLQRLACEGAVAPSPLSPLTRRELEVLQLLAQGKTNREIGVQLVVSPGTVKVHVERILAKLNVADRTQAAVRAVELGLLRQAAES